MVMSKVSIADAKAKLSEYLARVSDGERIVICRHNKPLAELRAVEDVRIEPRALGPLAGRPAFELPAAFFDPLDDDELEQWDHAPVAPASGPSATRHSRVAEKKPAYGGQQARRGRKRS